jgi:hypothetical protein
MKGDLTPSPPPTYESPSVRRKVVKESLRRTGRGKESDPRGVRAEHRGREAVGSSIKPPAGGDLNLQDRQRSHPTASRNRVRGDRI